MKTEDKKEFFTIMFGLAENFGGQVSKEGLKFRFEAMSDFTISEVSAAATFIINNREKDYPPVPTVKEFRDAIESLNGPKVSPKAKAQLQVDEVITFLKHRGAYATPNFKDPITARLMSSRWPYASWATTVTIDELETWWPKKFIDAYLAYDELGEVEAIALPPVNNVVKLVDLSKQVAKNLKRKGNQDGRNQ